MHFAKAWVLILVIFQGHFISLTLTSRFEDWSDKKCQKFCNKDCHDFFDSPNWEWHECHYANEKCYCDRNPPISNAPKASHPVWKIILIVLGVLAGIGLIGGLIAYFACCRRSQRNNNYNTGYNNNYSNNAYARAGAAPAWGGQTLPSTYQYQTQPSMNQYQTQSFNYY